MGLGLGLGCLGEGEGAGEQQHLAQLGLAQPQAALQRVERGGHVVLVREGEGLGAGGRAHLAQDGVGLGAGLTSYEKVSREGTATTTLRSWPSLSPSRAWHRHGGMVTAMARIGMDTGHTLV